MTQIYDVRGNPFRGLVDAITNETIVDARAPTANVAALAATVVVDLNGASIAAIDLRSAAFTGTVVFEGTIDGTNWVILLGLNGTTPISLINGAGVVNSQVTIGVSGYRSFRVRVSLYTSGILTVGVRASAADFAIFAAPLPAPLTGTATGLAGAAVTLTIAAGTAGLFHYFTRILVQRFFSAAGLAAATPTLVTTTNLPGARVFSFATAGILGSSVAEIMEPAQPLKSTVAATATTIVCPAVADTIWRVTADYSFGG